MSTTSMNPAETYERYMVPSLFGPSASLLIDLAPPSPGARALDIACGTGIVARTIGARFGSQVSLTAIDLNPAMLDVARIAADTASVEIDFHQGRAEELPYPDASFDLVTCQYGLMFFTDRAAALKEMRRVLAPAGHLALSTWQAIDRHPVYVRLARVIEARFGVTDVRDIFALGDDDQLHALVTKAGFTGIEIRPVELTARFPNPDTFLAWEIEMDTAALPQMQHLDAAERTQIIGAIAGEMRETLASVTEGGEVVLPFHAWIVTAHASG